MALAVLAACQTGTVFRTWPDRPPPEAAQLGDYLAASVAGLNHSADEAAIYWERVWRRQPTNPKLLERAVRALIVVGDLPHAARLVRGAKEQTLAGAPTARLLLMVTDFGRAPMPRLRRLGAATDDTDPYYREVAGDLLDWAAVARGLEPSRAPQRVIDVGPDLYHRALLLQRAGKGEGALLLFTKAWEAGDRYAFAATALLGLLLESGRIEAASRLAATFETQLQQAPSAMRFAQALRRGDTPTVKPLSPRGAAARIMFLRTNLHAALPEGVAGTAGQHNLIVLLRLALWLDPEFTPARSRLARFFARWGIPERALAELERIDARSASHALARMQAAYLLLNAGRKDEALLAARGAAKAVGYRAERMELARLLIYLEQYRDSELLMDAVAAADAEAGREDWQVYFTRGRARERLGRWGLAVTDLRKALTLVPNSPDILNYLGYSWLDRGENIEEAFALVQRAAEARPYSGAFVDSLGWAYFRLGRFEEAVWRLEEANVLAPADPLVVDHLGDAYWRVGRTQEARYQWRKALDLDPEPQLRARLETKLAAGLDAATPLP